MIQSRFRALLAEREMSEGRRISLRDVSRDTGVSVYTLRGLADSTLREYPAEVLSTICVYLKCTVGDLLIHKQVERVAEENKSARLAVAF